MPLMAAGICSVTVMQMKKRTPDCWFDDGKVPAFGYMMKAVNMLVFDRWRRRCGAPDGAKEADWDWGFQDMELNSEILTEPGMAYPSMDEDDYITVWIHIWITEYSSYFRFRNWRHRQIRQAGRNLAAPWCFQHIQMLNRQHISLASSPPRSNWTQQCYLANIDSIRWCCCCW